MWLKNKKLITPNGLYNNKSLRLCVFASRKP